MERSGAGRARRPAARGRGRMLGCGPGGQKAAHMASGRLKPRLGACGPRSWLAPAGRRRGGAVRPYAHALCVLYSRATTICGFLEMSPGVTPPLFKPDTNHNLTPAREGAVPTWQRGVRLALKQATWLTHLFPAPLGRVWLGRFRSRHWMRRRCAARGDWLWEGTLRAYAM